MRKLLTFAALLTASFAVTSCDNRTAGADGYVFDEPTWVVTELDVNVILVSDLHEMSRLRAQYGVPVPPGAVDYAFARVSPDGKCTIWKVDSRNHYAPEMDGHELNHCIYGEWHGKEIGR